MANIGVRIVAMGVYLLIPLVLLAVLQVFLSSRKNKWLGLILPVLAFLWGTMIAVGSVALIPDVSLWNSTAGYDADGFRATIGFYVDEKDNLQAFSDLMIEDKQTGETAYYKLEFDENGELIGSKEALEYRDVIETIYDGTDKLYGASTSISEMKSIYRREHLGETIARFAAPLLYYIPLIVFIVIYVFARKKVRRDNMAQGVAKMMIDDL